jgi:hypothetical protein
VRRDLMLEGQTLLYAALVHEHADLTAALLPLVSTVNTPNPEGGRRGAGCH